MWRKNYIRQNIHFLLFFVRQFVLGHGISIILMSSGLVFWIHCFISAQPARRPRKQSYVQKEIIIIPKKSDVLETRYWDLPSSIIQSPIMLTRHNSFTGHMKVQKLFNRTKKFKFIAHEKDIYRPNGSTFAQPDLVFLYKDRPVYV